jgi:putative transposase
VKAKLPLSEREYRCEHCGMVLDRDVNAARNLAMLVLQVGTGSPGVARRLETPVDGDGPPFGVGDSSTKREAGTTSRGLDETGTADWQRPTT